MKSQILRIYKNKKSMFFFWSIVLLPFIDIIQLYLIRLKWDIVYNPWIASFLSGSTQGHISQILMFWFLPIYLLIICSEDYIQDVQSGYNTILISKVGRKKYFRNKLLISFLVPAVMILMTLTLNLIFCAIFFAGGTDSLGFFETNWSGNTLASYSQDHPLFIYIIFLLNVSLMTGLAGLLGASISFIFPKRTYTYPIVFFVWFFQITINNSIIGVFQPFSEFDFNYLLPIWLRSLTILIIIPLISYVFKVKTDEL